MVGDAGILVDPTDTSAMAEAMQRVLTEPDLAEDLVRKGLEQAKRFSWEDATRGVIELCHEVHTAR